jgi:hypothetical protein
MHQPILTQPLRWLVIAVLTAFLAVQWSPYLALANLPPISSPSGVAREETSRLAQLKTLPDGMIALPNFSPEVSGFQFSVGELIQAIDLEKNAVDWEEVLTEQLQKLFGTQVCIGEEVRTCVLTSAAQDWLKTQLERIDLGMAEGMATAALALWQPEPQAQIPWWQRLINFLLGRTVFGLARTLFELQTFIANFFLMQSVDEVFQPTQVIRDTLTPTQILLNILEVFFTGSLDPFTMGIYRIIEGGLTEGHALTPYQVEDKGEGKYWVYVYDSNYPAERSVPLEDLHVEFDTITDTWSYQPTASAPLFKGDVQSKTLDLSHLSWRQPENSDQVPAEKGPFTCPFCDRSASAPDNSENPSAPAPEAPSIAITLVGEGQLSVMPFDAEDDTRPIAPEKTVLVPFRGGLYRHVPASYKLPPETLNQPLEVVLEGNSEPSNHPITLQLTASGYTADFEDLALPPGEQLTLYLNPTDNGPELTFVADQPAEIPRLSIHLTDSTKTYVFDSSTPEGFSQTERQVAKSSGFEVRGLKLPQGKRVGIATKGDLKRLYFADDDGQDSRYGLTVRNRIVIRDRIQVGETNPDFLNYTLTYEEDLQASNLLVDAQAQAFFNYDPAFIDPAERSRQELIAAFEQRDFPITIAYEPLSTVPGGEGPMAFQPATEPPIGQRVFQGALQKTGTK